MNPKYIDAHCHVQFEQYDPDRDALIEKMKEREVAGIVVGCDLVSSTKAVELVEKYDHLYASVGLHPNHEGDEVFDELEYRKLALSSKVVAIGECGLDYYRPTEVTDDVKNRQKTLLEKQILLASELDKPLIIHSRPSKGTQDAYHDLIAILRVAKVQFPNLRGDFTFLWAG